MGIVEKTMEKTDEMRDSVRRNRLESRLERTESDLTALKDENHVLRDQLDQERATVRQVTEAVSEQKPHRVRRVFTLVMAAGGAYVAGSAAGRERYEQIRSWFKRRSDEGWAAPSEMRDRAAETVADAGVKAERATDRAGSAVKDAATRAGEAAKTAATRAGSVAKDKIGQVGSTAKDAANQASSTIADNGASNG
jgi:hypothetical protein